MGYRELSANEFNNPSIGTATFLPPEAAWSGEVAHTSKRPLPWFLEAEHGVGKARLLLLPSTRLFIISLPRPHFASYEELISVSKFYGGIQIFIKMKDAMKRRFRSLRFSRRCLKLSFPWATQLAKNVHTLIKKKCALLRRIQSLSTEYHPLILPLLLGSITDSSKHES